MGIKRKDKTEMIGICFCNYHLKWLAYLTADKKRYQKYSETKEQAIIARKELIRLYRD